MVPSLITKVIHPMGRGMASSGPLFAEPGPIAAKSGQLLGKKRLKRVEIDQIQHLTAGGVMGMFRSTFEAVSRRQDCLDVTGKAKLSQIGT